MINRSYSFYSLATIIASEEFKGDIVDFGRYEFNNASVEVKGHMKGYFDEQKQTHDHPGFCDLVDVYVEITSVNVSGDDFEKSFSFEEKCKLEEMIKNLMI